MSYFAATFARTFQAGWEGSERGLDQVETLEDLVEQMRDAGHGAEPVVCLIEENDEWFAVVRVDGDSDPRLFLSDSRAPLSSELAAILYEGVGPRPETEGQAEPARPAEGEPGGDADLLADLDMPADELVELCVAEGLLPADALAAVAERLGFPEELEGFR